MLVLLSPAKQLNFDTSLASNKQTEPRLKQHTETVMRSLRKLTRLKLKRLMKLSDDLTELNYQRHQDWLPDPDPKQTAAAAAAFRGETYLGLRAETWDGESLAWAQQHVRILSGLYGLLRPLDGIQPYRLEMGSALKLGRGKKLKEYWRKHLNELLAEDVLACAKDTGRPLIMDLASNEYGGAVSPEAMPEGTLIIKTNFLKQRADGSLTPPGFAVKRARGAMASFIVRNRITCAAAAKDFSDDGYRFEPKLSSTTELAFVARP